MLPSQESANEYFGKGHQLKVIKPFHIKSKGKYIEIPEGTIGTVIRGQDLYGYVTLEFRNGRKKHLERSVVTDYSLYVEDLDYQGNEAETKSG